LAGVRSAASAKAPVVGFVVKAQLIPNDPAAQLH